MLYPKNTYGIRIMFDCTRFVENATFHKNTGKEGYADKTIAEIVKEMFSYAE